MARSRTAPEEHEEAQGTVPESAKTPYYPALDGIRAVAILMVLAAHYVPQWLPIGWMGVQLFFVLSGFLITGILFDTRKTEHRWRNFYARRSLRIFPLYYGVLIFVVVVGWLTHAQLLRVYWLWLIYAQNFFWLIDKGQHGDVIRTSGGHTIAVIGHLWSLAVEEQFYLVWPWVVFWVTRRVTLMRVCFCLIVLRLVLGIVWQHHLSPQSVHDGLLYRMLPTQSDGFLMGGVLALWLRGNPSLRVLQHSGKIAGAALLMYGTLLYFLRGHDGLTGGNPLDYHSSFQVMLGLPLCNAVSALLLLATVRSGSWAYRICALAPMRSVGRVSYGMYIFHQMLFLTFWGTATRFATRWGFPEVVNGFRAGVGLGATLLVSYASYYLYERQFLLLKNRFTAIRGARARSLATHPIS